MAESYRCDGHWVYFSNEASQTLQLTWAKIADLFPEEAGMPVLADALKNASKDPTGGAAMGIDDEFLEEPFRRRDVKDAWLKVMNVLIDDLVEKGPITGQMDINWNNTLRKSWYERLMRMRDCLEGQIRT